MTYLDILTQLTTSTISKVLIRQWYNSATPTEAALDFIGNVTNTGNITTQGFDMTDLLTP